MTERSGRGGNARSTSGDIERAFAGDGLLASLSSAAREAGTGGAYLSGLYLTDVLTGVRPGGILVVCGGDTAAWSRLFASATERIDISLEKSGGVHCLVTKAREGGDGRCVAVVPLAAGGIEASLRNAGFTAAATAVDITGAGPGALIDPFGAVEDLDRKKLRTVPGFRPAGAPAGAIRAVELCHRYGLEAEGKTLAALKEASCRFVEHPPASVWAAIARLASSDGLSRIAGDLRRTGVLSALLPEVSAVFDTPQNYYHHLGVWEHTLETLDNLEEMLEEPARFFKAYGARVAAHLGATVEGGVDRRAFLGFAALVHDIGKPAAMTVEPNGRIRFKGHQREGARLARGVAARLGLGQVGRRRLVGLVGHHMRLGFLLKEGESAESRLRAISEMGSLTVEVAMLSLADRLATRGEASSEEALERYRRMVNRVIADYFWNRDCPELVRGRDVIIHAGVPPGPEVARMLFAVRVAQREATTSSRQQALEFMAPDFKGRMR